jgi:3-hydroxyacyl-[acyl-carrier-protein] dehydratase
MRFRDDDVFRLGSDVVQRLIPHRRPLLMVDAIEAFSRGAQPTLWARRQISSNEPVFDGHFPGLHLWPGVYTIEGMGQSTLLLTVLLFLVDRHGPDILDKLKKLDRTYTVNPGPPVVLDELSGDPRAGMAGQIDVKLLAPVYAGSELRYRVALSHRMDAFARFDVEAEVAGTVVARGTMTGVIGPLLKDA